MSRVSSATSARESIANGSGSAFESTTARSARTSTSPVAIFGFTASGLARDHRAVDLDHPLGAHRVERRERRRRLVRLGHDLRHAAAVAQIEEEHAAVVAPPLHPGLQQDLRSDIRTGQRPRSSALHDFTSCP